MLFDEYRFIYSKYSLPIKQKYSTELGGIYADKFDKTIAELADTFDNTEREVARVLSSMDFSVMGGKCCIACNLYFDTMQSCISSIKELLENIRGIECTLKRIASCEIENSIRFKVLEDNFFSELCRDIRNVKARCKKLVSDLDYAVKIKDNPRIT